MSKADDFTTPIRSRRAVLAGIATLPIVAALPVAALAIPPNADDPVIALAERAIDAWNDFDAKCIESSDCEEGVNEWRKLNPGPTMREVFVGSDADYLAFHAGLSPYDPNAELRDASKEYETAMSEWRARRRTVERETGYTRAEKAQERASERFGDIRDELVYVRPISIAGLRAKANAARVSSDEDLQQQIVFDIGVLFRDLDGNEKPIAAELGKAVV
jgi:hypothetical protein